jgi:hypothetical protein
MKFMKRIQTGSDLQPGLSEISRREPDNPKKVITITLFKYRRQRREEKRKHRNHWNTPNRGTGQAKETINTATIQLPGLRPGYKTNTSLVNRANGLLRPDTFQIELDE